MKRENFHERRVVVLLLCSFALGMVQGLVAQNMAAGGIVSYRYRVIHNFSPSGGDGFAPESSLVMDYSGNLYGTTVAGGRGCGTPGCGVVYKLTVSPGDTWTERILHYFNGQDGAWPFAPVILDSNGVLYGTTSRGGSRDAGVAFKLIGDANGDWHHFVLHSFDGRDGGQPCAALVLDGRGHFYGTTSTGGLRNAGVIFESSDNNIYSSSVMHEFGTGMDGAQSFASLVADAAGNLYGVTQAGGAYGFGTIFEMRRDAAGVSWTEIVLYSFHGTLDGAGPFAGLTWDTAGNLYGTTSAGGAADAGTVFRLSPHGATWTETTLHAFTGQDDGGRPYGQLVFDPQGNLYGTTNGGGPRGAGTVFRLSPRSGGTWTESVLYGFSGRSDGGWPGAGVIVDGAGNIFGTAVLGGNSGDPDHSGVVFELSPQ